MNREAAREELKRYLAEYLGEFHGIQNTGRNFRCLNPAHEDRNPSMGFDKAHNRVHCFSCDFSADIVDLIAMDRNLSTADAFSWGYEHYGIEVERKDSFSSYRGTSSYKAKQAEKPRGKGADLAAYFEECAAKMEGSSGMEYLQGRGLSAKTIQHFGIGFDPAFQAEAQTWQAVIIPTGQGSYVARNIGVKADDEEQKKNRVRKRGPSVPFNLAALSEDASVFITEGEIDALSVIECGAQAVGLGSTANIDALLRYIDDHKIQPLHPLLLCLDNDEDGEKATRKLAEELGRRGITFRPANIAGEHKDPNAALVANEFSFMGAVNEALSYEDERAKKERDEYFSITGSGRMGSFLREVEYNKRTPPISTGFMSLDNSLGGGLYGGLVIIGAISSLGKTAFVLQVADSIAKGDEQQPGRDVLFCTLEMSAHELMARSISRETFEAMSSEKEPIKTMLEILYGQGHETFTQADFEAISHAEAVYSRYGSRIFFHEGMTGDVSVLDVRNAVERHVKITGQVPVVIVDYLQQLAPIDSKATDKQKVDDSIRALKRISRDFKTPVIVISSFNRVNYRNPVAMESFKESGTIEYSSDILIGLQLAGAGRDDFEVNKAKVKEPRDVELVVLKNRNWRMPEPLKFSFYPAHNFFEEHIENALNPDKVERRQAYYAQMREDAKRDAGSFYART